jgi:hypothetical protein
MALFGGSKPDHPMADPKQARVLIAELPAHDAAKALEEVTFWLDSVRHTAEFKLDYRYWLYDLLDQAGKNHHRKLTQDYMATDRLEKFRENKLWNAVFEYRKTLGDCYGQCVEEFQAGASGAGSIKKELPAIVGRALRAETLKLKWGLLRYGPVEGGIWGEIGRLYEFAETKGIAEVAVDIYPGAHGEGTVREEFLKALMLAVSSLDGLTPLRQDIAERTVAHFGNLFAMQLNPAPGCKYFFDLAAGRPAARVMKGAETSKSTRFFGAGKAESALAQLMQEIKDKEGVPSDINLGGTYDVDVVLPVMRHLSLYWSDHPPARGSERRKIATRMTVVHGFGAILKRLLPVDDEAGSLDFQVKDAGESWIVENVSEGGFGAIISQVKGDWIKVGSLLGVQTETAKFWGAGVIRRLTRDEHQQRRVGIQLLSKALIPVKLWPAGVVAGTSTFRNGDQALLLSSSPDKNGEVSLLLELGSFTRGQALDMQVGSKVYYLLPNKLVEGGEDFDCAKFKIMQRE